MKPINSLPPFKRFCVTIGNLPSSYVDSMSYYECLMWLCKYLKDTVIPAINENAEAVNELINWFNNLDVQDEIDHKLDEMVKSGELQEIISEYLNSKAIFGFDTVADMKSSTNLINGSYAKTLGYNSLNDGGSSLYRIRTITNEDVVDEGSIIALNNTELIAELIILNNTITPEEFGTSGNGVTDDSTNFIKAFNYAINNNYKFKANKTYKINDTLTIEGNYHDVDINTLNYNGISNAITIKGSYNNLKIKKLIGIQGTSQGGIVLQAEYRTVLNSNNIINFEYIEGFSKGIYLDNETANSWGIQYNEIKGNMIVYCDYGIYIGMSSSQTETWVNQNYFDKIRVNCTNGIYINNEYTYQNECNSNIFNEIGIEADSAIPMTYGIYNKHSANNRFINCRASEIQQNEILINEVNTAGDSTTNIYDFTQPIPINKVNMLNGTIKSTIFTASNIMLSNNGAKFFTDGSYLLFDNEWKKTGRIYNAYNRDLDLTASDRKDVGYDMVYRFGADSARNYVFKLNEANIDRSIVKVYITNLPGGTYSISVVDSSDNVLLAGGIINSTGMWTIEKESANQWYAYK